MTSNYIKNSILVPSQLPEYIRDDPSYANFIAFIQAYYEWLEQDGNVLNTTKKVLSYDDIDQTTDEFLAYFTNDFLQYFPEDVLVDKRKAVKFARELYQSKGTLASYKLLFKVLYNSEFNLFLTNDAVLKASDGLWYQPKSIRLLSSDTRFFESINYSSGNYRVIGETTKALATIENVKLNNGKIEIFISNMTRQFQSGEYIRIVDGYNDDLIVDGENLRAKIVGQINKITIDPNNRGLGYDIEDPVVVYGGLNNQFGKGAFAKVGKVTSGSLNYVTVSNGGYGYRDDGNTVININSTYGTYGASLSVDSVDTSNAALVSLFPIDSIQLHKNIALNSSSLLFTANSNATANTPLLNTLRFVSFETYPLSSVFVDTPGSGMNTVPTITADSRVMTDYTSSLSINDVNYANSFAHLESIGILAPLLIANTGSGYSSGDTITLSGGSGLGAYANLTIVGGKIVGADYFNGSGNNYPIGGMSYRPDALPSVTINTSTGSGASIIVPGILGLGAQFSPTFDKVGAITSIIVTEPGEDYTSTPSISLKVLDIAVTVPNLILPLQEEIVYQGVDLETASFIGYVESIEPILTNQNPSLTVYRLRLYNYTLLPSTTTSLNVFGSDVVLVPTNTNTSIGNYFPDSTGIRVYGNGSAVANASFLNGLVIAEGRYLNTRGQPSSFDILQDENHNSFTYMIDVEKEISKYRDILLNLLHPSGMKLIGRYNGLSDSNFNTKYSAGAYTGLSFRDLANTDNSFATISTDFNNKSNNIIQFNNIGSANLANIFAVNTSIIELITTNGPNVKCEIIAVNHTSNTVTIKDNVWLTFANVAIGTANVTAHANVINIISPTGLYDIVNNGHYSNTQYPLKDVIFAGDTISVNNETKVVSNFDYANGIVTLTSNLSNSANGYISVKRVFHSNSSPTLEQIYVWGLLDTTIDLSLTDGLGQILTTENHIILLKG